MEKIIPPIFHNKELIQIIDLWIDDGFESYDKLDDGIKDKLITICLKLLGNDACDSIVDVNNLNQTLHHLRKYIETGCKDHALDLAENMRKSCHMYFEEILSLIFDERCEEKEYSFKIEHGLMPTSNRINGEISWIQRG
jgi:hypothetical protein